MSAARNAAIYKTSKPASFPKRRRRRLYPKEQSRKKQIGKRGCSSKFSGHPVFSGKKFEKDAVSGHGKNSAAERANNPATNLRALRAFLPGNHSYSGQFRNIHELIISMLRPFSPYPYGRCGRLTAREAEHVRAGMLPPHPRRWGREKALLCPPSTCRSRLRP